MSLDDIIKESEKGKRRGQKQGSIKIKENGFGSVKHNNRHDRNRNQPYRKDHHKHRDEHSKKTDNVLQVDCEWANENSGREEIFRARIGRNLLVEAKSSGSIEIGHEIPHGKVSFKAYNLYLQPFGYKIFFEGQNWYVKRIGQSAWKELLDKPM